MMFLYPVTFLIFLSVLLITFVVRNHYKTFESKTYLALLITSCIGIIFNILFYGFSYLNNDILICILSKIYLIYLLTWVGLFTLYSVIISNNYNFEDMCELKLPYGILFYSLSIVATLILPNEVSGYMGIYTLKGASINYIYFYTLISIMVIAFNISLNIHKFFQKKYLPIYIFFILMVLMMISNSVSKNIMYFTYEFSFITFLMYFTMENPDVKLIKELRYSRILSNKLKTDTDNILNNMKLELNESLSDYIDFGYIDTDKMTKEQMKKKISDMKQISLKLSEKISNIIEIGKIESDNYSLNKDKYNPNELLIEIKKYFNNKKYENDITIEKYELPEINNILYGDPLKVKQIILHTFNYLFDTNEKGKIKFILEYKIVGRLCRLKFNFVCKDMNIDTDDKDNLNYQIIIRLIELLNGKIEVKKTNEKSVLSIIINQLVVNNYELINNSKLKHKDTQIKKIDLSNKRIILFDDSNEIIKEIEDQLKAYNADVYVVNSINRLNNLISEDKTFDLLIIDDIINSSEMKSDDIISHCSPRIIKRICEYDLPVVLLITGKINKFESKYNKMGYKYFIEKPVTNNKLISILKKI